MNKKEELLSLNGAGISIKRKHLLENIDLVISSGELTGIYGLNGSGKSLLAGLISGRIKNDTGMIEKDENLRTAIVSSAERKRMLEEDRHNDDSEFMQGKEDPGRSAGDIYRLSMDDGRNETDLERYEKMFEIAHIRNRGIRYLSTGEFRKMMIVRCLLSKPDILILDDPYTGLDIATRNGLHSLISEIKKEVKAIILVTGRLDDLEDCGSLFMLENGSIHEYKSLKDIHKMAEAMAPVFFTEKENNSAKPAEKDLTAERTELVRMQSVKMSYYDDRILTDINWQVTSGEHWQISGPNGSGKSSLLSLVTGDSPKAYGQELYLFGRKRGSGETVWEIKQQIGYVSGVLQRQHRISQSVLSVVISGFFDTIGLYDQPNPVQIEKARHWCREFGLGDCLDSPFDSLSEGLMRSVLIIRAIVKHPKLLILDEPCQGLDDLNSKFVIDIARHIIRMDHSTLLYVSHDPLYRMDCVDKLMELVPHTEGGYTSRISTQQ